MEYVIIGLLVLLVILTVISLFKNINEGKITDKVNEMHVNLTKELGDFKSDINRNFNEDFTKMNERIENRLNQMDHKVNERLDVNFEKTNKTFSDVLERLSKIDEAQKKIDSLSSDIVSLQGILTDKKSRGIYGEVNLNHILSSVFGEKNEKVYKLQFPFDNNTIADAVIFAPEPLGLVAIDSKFPLENYRIMVDKKFDKASRDTAEKLFKSDVKKHIDAIASKYIIPGVTSDQAIMFLPAEAIFAELNAYHNDIIEYAYKKRVWITSPTTLMSTLTTIEVIIKNSERDKYAKVIQDELRKLSVEFNRYRERWDKLSRSIETVSKDVEDIHITTDKITKRFDSINGVEIEKIED